MYQQNETVWAILYPFDPPKKCIIVEAMTLFVKKNGGKVRYIVQYKHKKFQVKNVDVYPNQMDAEIYWAVCIQEDYHNTLKYPDMFLTDDYERADRIATEILSKYAEKVPHLLLKYL